MRRVVRLTALGLAMAGAPALAPVLAMAQTVPSADPTPLQARGFSASLSVADTYDNNVGRSDDQLAALRGIKQHDQLIQPQVAVDLVQPIDRQSIFIDGTIGYDSYQRNTILNRERIDIGGGLRGQVERCTATLGGNYRRSQNNLEDITAIGVKDTLTDKAVTLSATCQSQIGFSPFISLSRDWEDNSSTLNQSSNYQTFSANGGVAYNQPVIGEISVYGGYTKTQFPNRFIVGTEDGYKLYTGGVRYDRKLGARIEGTVAFAYTSLKPNSSGASAFSGPTYQADITYRASGRITTSLHASRSTQPTPLAQTTFNIQQLVSADASYQLGARGALRFGASNSVQDLKGPLLISFLNITHETTNEVFASGSYTFNRRLTLVMDVRHEDRRTNLPFFDYQDTLLTLTAKSSF